MKLHLKQIGKPFHLQATNETGNTVEMDGSPEIGGTNLGTRPMELLVMGLMGCSSIDVLMILGKKKVEIEDYQVSASAEREKVGDAKLFSAIELLFKIKGTGNEAQYRQAIELSLQKYCSVAKTLEKTAKISYKLEM